MRDRSGFRSSTARFLALMSSSSEMSTVVLMHKTV
jgi:hypothetical protein